MTRVKESYISRREVVNTTYDVFSLEDGKLTKLDTIVIEGKPQTRALAKKYGVKNVVCEQVEQNVQWFRVPVSKFMEIAEPYEPASKKEGVDNE